MTAPLTPTAFDLVEPITPTAKPKAEPGPEYFNDAELLGVETEGYLAALDQPATLMTGKLYGERDRRNTQDGEWVPVTATWAQWIAGAPTDKNKPEWGFSRHPVSKTKEGDSIVFGSSIGGSVSKSDMETMYAAGFDFDSGVSLDELISKVEQEGLFCLIYSSHSNGKTSLEVKRDLVIQKCKVKGAPTIEDVRTYLRDFSKDQYSAEFLSKIEITQDKKQVKGGVVIVLRTPPQVKVRAIFPFAQPVKLVDLAETHAAALDRWTNKMTGFASKVLGFPFDTSCTDAGRRFYTARHRDGAEWDCVIVRGDPLDFADMPEVKKQVYLEARKAGGGANPFLESGAGAGFGGMRQEVLAPSGASLTAWHSKAKDRFLITEVIDDHCPEQIRAGSGDKIYINCPFGDHPAGGETSTYAKNPDNTADDDKGRYWTVHCSHDTCQGRGKLDFVAEMLRQKWFDEDQLFNGPYMLEDEGGDAEDDEPVREDGGEVSAADLHTRFRKMIRKGFAPGEDMDAIKQGKKDSGLTQANVQKLWTKALTEIADEEAAAMRESRKAAPRPDFVPLEQATVRSVERAAENAAWLPDFVQYRRGEDGAWFYARDPDRPKEWVRACRAFEVPFIAFGEGEDGKRTNEITIRYAHRSRQRGVVESTYKIGDTYRDTGAFLSPLVDEGFEIDPQVSAGTIVRLLRAVDTSNEAVLIDKAGWHGSAYVAPSGAVAHAGDQRFILNPKARISAKTQGTLAEHHAAATTALTGATGRFILPGYLSSLAGCLVNFIGHSLSPVISNEGKAKQGKTSAGKMGAAHFGPPDQTGLFGKADATPTAIENLAERGAGAVVVLDEGGASKADSTETQRLILQWADGSGRARGKADGGIQRTKTWTTCFVLSSEIGIVTMMEAAGVDIKTGAVSRVFAVNFDGAPILDRNSPEVEAIRILSGDDKERAVFGVTGLVFAEALAGAGREAVRERVSAVETAWADLATGAGERVVTTAAILTVAGEIAQEAGLFGVQVPVRAMMRELLEDSLSAGAAHLDTDKQSIEKLRRAILHGVGTGTIVTMHEDRDPSRVGVLGYFGHVAANGQPDHAKAQLWERHILDAAKGGRDLERAEADAREARTYILPVDRLGKLGITTDPKALMDRLEKEGALVRRKKGDRFQKWHDYVPGEGGGIKNIRVTGAFVHGAGTE